MVKWKYTRGNTAKLALEPLTDGQVLFDIEKKILGFDTKINNVVQRLWLSYAQTTIALSDITDVDFTNLADGQVLAYDDATSKWINKTLSLATSSTVGVSKPDNVSIGVDSNGVLSVINNTYVNGQPIGGGHIKTEIDIADEGELTGLGGEYSLVDASTKSAVVFDGKLYVLLKSITSSDYAGLYYWDGVSSSLVKAASYPGSIDPNVKTSMVVLGDSIYCMEVVYSNNNQTRTPYFFKFSK